jgi:hypothetical protein
VSVTCKCAFEKRNLTLLEHLTEKGTDFPPKIINHYYLAILVLYDAVTSVISLYFTLQHGRRKLCMRHVKFTA